MALNNSDVLFLSKIHAFSLISKIIGEMSWIFCNARVDGRELPPHTTPVHTSWTGAKSRR
jgi:hypothetical protein